MLEVAGYLAWLMWGGLLASLSRRLSTCLTSVRISQFTWSAWRRHLLPYARLPTSCGVSIVQTKPRGRGQSMCRICSRTGQLAISALLRGTLSNVWPSLRPGLDKSTLWADGARYFIDISTLCAKVFGLEVVVSQTLLLLRASHDAQACRRVGSP